MTIYVLIHECGEYSDHTNHVVRAYRTVGAARRAVVRATELGHFVVDRYGLVDLHKKRNDSPEVRELLALDPGFDWDSSGFNYYYAECELSD